MSLKENDGDLHLLLFYLKERLIVLQYYYNSSANVSAIRDINLDYWRFVIFYQWASFDV